ncbi:hypothetical protein VTP01DRAFT_9967 [Rhizomucor pusillus]|uniref:uncharacterized protein n=1 Tax=Rhizomucor pusillus TaxID=4840 RepID=UPI003744636B
MTIEESFQTLCQSVFPDGLKAALVTDKDGVAILKCISPDAPANIAAHAVPATFAVVNNQASKLGLGQNTSIVTMYDLYQVVQLDHNPMIITLVGDAASNTGRLKVLGRDIMQMTQPLIDTLLRRERQP